MKRRSLILGGAAASASLALPHLARAQTAYMPSTR